MATIRNVSKETYGYLRDLDSMGYLGDISSAPPPFYASAVHISDRSLDVDAVGDTEEEALRKVRDICDARSPRFKVRASRGDRGAPTTWTTTEASVRIDQLQPYLLQLQAELHDWTELTVYDADGESMRARRSDWDH